MSALRDAPMAIVSSRALFDVLREFSLLSKQQLHEVFCLAKGRCADARSLARALIQRGWFTVFQMNQLLAGNSETLVLGPYQILDRLGKGGQSEVYKARHPEYGWTVALKVVRSELLSTPEAAEQYLLEMESMAQLQHPNIVQFWDVDKAGDVYYCAMEFIEGTDLGKVVRLQGYLSPAQASEYIRQTALGLQHAHEHNLVHRDIKPVNLFLAHQLAGAGPPFHNAFRPQPSKEAAPLIKILDWGLASLRPPVAKGDEAQKAGHARNLIGTADYIAPEQAMNPHGVDIRADIYSLGCTFYYLLTGKTPFDGATVMQKILQHQTAEPPPVESLNSDVPPGLAGIVRRMMAKQPKDRFQTPAAVALALSPFCRGSLSTTALPRRTVQPRPGVERGRPQDDTPMPAGPMPLGLPQKKS
jgi:eukaryotic-like serine/threonine-protein kinase